MFSSYFTRGAKTLDEDYKLMEVDLEHVTGDYNDEGKNPLR